ncbi:MAG: MFS transporter [Chloroflexota bacterium]|nr:MFS transporter [Dehalococcoidia bacterium]MDW8254128.1 MFS transporter [Chloroflexota bacterium]
MSLPRSLSPTLAPSETAAPRRWLVLSTTVLGHAIKHFFAAGLFVIIPELKAGLDLSNAQVGALSTARNLAGGLANLPAGFIADRWPERRAETLGVSLAAIGVFAFLLGRSDTYLAAVANAAFLAAAISFWHPAAIGAISSLFARQRGLAIALHGTGGSIGEALGPLITGLLLAAFSWAVLLQASLLPAALFGLLIWLLLRTAPGTAVSPFGLRRYLAGVGQLVADRRLMLVLLFAGGFAGGQSVVQTFLPVYLRESVGVSPATIGVYLALAQVVGIGSQPLMGWFSDRWGRKVVLVPALMVLGAAYSALAVVSPGVSFLLVIALMGAFMYSLMAIFLASAIDLVQGSVQATTVALVFGIATAVAGIAPGIAGVLADLAGPIAPFLFAGGLVLAVGIVAAVTQWRRPPA